MALHYALVEPRSKYRRSGFVAAVMRVAQEIRELEAATETGFREALARRKDSKRFPREIVAGKSEDIKFKKTLDVSSTAKIG